MKIWLINNYNMLPEHGQLTRNFSFGVQLKKMGHEPVAFVGSHPHNTKLQLIEGNEKYRVYQEEPFPWVLIKTRNYDGSKKSQVISMFEFYRNMKIAAEHFEKPDVIIGSSAHPLAALLAIQLGKKFGCKKIVEIRDLWPESIVAYGILGKNNPIILFMRRFEKWLYTHADALIFTMGGGYDYILNQGWEKEIPVSKVTHINNGIDLELFEYNLKHFTLADADLDDEQTYKIIYTGSLRKANEQIFALFKAIELMQGKEYKNFRFLIYGKGDLLKTLKKECEEKQYNNVRLKGFVDKKYIPYILSKCNVAILNCEDNDILKYGGSQNKQFDYLAAGIPIISGETNKYSIIRNKHCGIAREFKTPMGIIEAIKEIKDLPENYSYSHIRSVAEDYDFKRLTEKLLKVIESC